MDFSIVSSTFDALRIPPPARLTLLDAATLASAHVPPFPPDIPALILGIDSKELALRVREVLLAMYPATHGIVWVESGKWNSSTSLRAREERELGELENFAFSGSSCLYVPALGEGTSFESFAEIVAHLRAPNGCPWDREQTHESLRKHLLEESYEAISAIDAGDFAHMREEFGDLLLQIVLHAQIAKEEQQFNISQVIQGIHSKIVANWEKLKEEERGKKKDGKGLLDGVPLALPALSQAQEYQDRAARVGFDWNEIDGVLDKLQEESE